jgi:hypothetical protein
MSIPKKNKPKDKRTFYEKVNETIKKQGRPSIRQEIKMYKDRPKFEGVVPKYQEPRSVNMPDEPSPKAKELMKQGKKVYFL